MNCDQCEGTSSGSCEGCGGCSNTALYLSPEELEMLRRFAQTPFLPAAAKNGPDGPVFLEEPGQDPRELRNTLRSLAKKGLIRVDYDIPISNFDYRAYGAYPLHGSMALTARGQAVVELMEIQGVEE